MTTLKSLLVFGCLSFLAVSAQSAIVIGTNGSYTYAWDLKTSGATPQFTDDSTHSSNVQFYAETPGSSFVIAQGTSSQVGFLEWHFQASSGLTLASDFTVFSRETYFGAARTNANSITGSWSINGVDYTPFVTTNGGGTTTDFYGTTALSASGYTGGQNLYIRFDFLRDTGTVGTDLQLFRTDVAGQQMFVVSGTVQPVPEPQALMLVACGLGGLLWLRRKNHQIA